MSKLPYRAGEPTGINLQVARDVSGDVLLRDVRVARHSLRVAVLRIPHPTERDVVVAGSEQPRVPHEVSDLDGQRRVEGVAESVPVLPVHSGT